MLIILGQELPLIYAKALDKPPLDHTFNVVFSNKVVPIRYKGVCHYCSNPSQIFKHQGYPLRAPHSLVIPPKSQCIVDTCFEVSIPKEFIAEVFSPFNASRIEQLSAPGVLLPGSHSVNIFLANLSDRPMTVEKGQRVAFLHFFTANSYISFYKVGDFSEFNLQEPTGILTIDAAQFQHSTPQKQSQIMSLLQKYKAIFSKGDHDLGCAKGVLHRIDTSTSDPIRLRAIHCSLAAKQVVSAKIQAFIDKGLLIPSHSLWSSPVLVVKMKDRSNRVVNDYSRLNSVTKKDSYSLPRIDDTLDWISGARFFSAMDLMSGYWQIELPPKKQEKCAIITTNGLFQPTCMPQGLCNAPATFQWAIDFMLSDLKLSCVLVYLDNINVFSRTFDDHLQLLEQVFKHC